jgi:hypothetical protein
MPTPTTVSRDPVSRLARRDRALQAGIFLSLSLLVALDASALQLQSWVATARIRSGSTTYASSPSPPNPPAPTDSTGFLEANGSTIVPPPPIDAGAISEFDLPSGNLGTAAGFLGAANFPIDSRAWDPYGGASASYFDELTVTSATLANGTPVTIRFAFALAHTEDAVSTVNEAVASADFTSTAAGVSGIVAADNRYLDLLETATFIENGIFLPPGTAEFTIQTTVGATFNFAIALDASSYGGVYVTGPPGSEVNAASSGWMSVGLSFGGEAVGADAQLVSGLLGGPFPAAGAVSTTAAEAAIPPNPLEVPEPGAGSMLLAGATIIAMLARARR